MRAPILAGVITTGLILGCTTDTGTSGGVATTGDVAAADGGALAETLSLSDVQRELPLAPSDASADTREASELASADLGPDATEPGDAVLGDTALGDASDTPATTELVEPKDVAGDSDATSAMSTPALVRLEPPGTTAAKGATVTLAWTATGATSCGVAVDGTAAGTGTQGKVDVTVVNLHRVVVTCEPEGAGAIAAATIARACEGKTVVKGLLGLGGSPTDGLGNALPESDTCLEIEGDATTADLEPALVARITRVTGALTLFHGGDNGLDFVALTSVGKFLPDYQNGAFPPGVEGVNFEYLSFPVLQDLGTFPALLHGGRAAFPKLTSGGIYAVGSVETFDLPPGATLTSFTYRGSTLDLAPRFSAGPLAGVTGDVVIRDNKNLPAAQVTALVTALGTIGGKLTVCGNLGEPECSE